MDVAKFIMVMRRVCQNSNCENCVLSSFCGKTWNGWTEIDTEEAVEIVEKWVEDHLAKTRLTEYKKMFPDCRLRDDGYPTADPCLIMDSYSNSSGDDCGKFSSCCECRKEFWNKVIE